MRISDWSSYVCSSDLRTIDRNEGILQNIRRDGRVPNGELRTMVVPNDLTLPAGRERTEVAATHIFDAPPEGAAADWTMSQDWRAFTPAQHATWRTLFDQQAAALRGYACADFLRGLDMLRSVAPGGSRFRRSQQAFEAGDRLGDRRGSGLDTERALFRASGEPPLSRRQFPAAARADRLQRRAGHVSRYFRPCPDARQPRLLRISGRLRPGGTARRKARRDRKSTRLNSVTNAQLVCRLLLEIK